MRCEQTGELVMGRCKSTNLCAYCARLAAVENAEMLALDAIDGQGPEVYVVLTTRSTVQAQSAYEEARHQLVRLLRQVFGRQVEYVALLEFTTGRAGRSGGLRRPHWNLLLKGVRADDVELVRLCVALTWCVLEDADIKAQHVGTVYEAGGLMRYLALHFQKEDQSPPDGWSGKRFNCSQRYFGELSVRAARQRACESLRWKRELWRTGDGEEATRIVTEARELVWVLATDRGAAVAGAVFGGGDSALRRGRAWREPDLLDSARYLLRDLEAGLCTPPVPHGGAPPGRGPQRQLWPEL